MRWWLLALAGCNSVLGVHEFSSPDAAAPDAEVDAPAPHDAAGVDADPLSAGLLARITFDGQPLGADVTGMGHDATCMGTCTQVAGRLGKAVQLGSGGAMTLAGQFDAKTPFTIAAWVDLESSPPPQECAFGRGQGSGEGYALCFRRVGGQSYEVDLVTSAGLSAASAQIGTGYTHFGLTWDKTVATLYINGMSALSRPTDLSTVTTGLVIGNDGHSNYFTGAIDDVRYYGRVVGADELLALTGGSQ